MELRTKHADPQIIAALDGLREEIRSLREEPTPEEKLLTARQVAEKLQVSVRTLRTITDTGELPCIRIRGSVRYDKRMVDAYISRCARGVSR